MGNTLMRDKVKEDARAKRVMAINVDVETFMEDDIVMDVMKLTNDRLEPGSTNKADEYS